jgi:hypothetical protein
LLLITLCRFRWCWRYLSLCEVNSGSSFLSRPDFSSCFFAASDRSLFGSRWHALFGRYARLVVGAHNSLIRNTRSLAQ